MTRLLSIDWDFFFPNPEAGSKEGEIQLFDWGHSENNPFMSSPFIWHIRAEGFLRHGFDLPRCVGWENFWSRFKFKPRTLIFVAESHSQAAGLSKHFDEVVNFDAHHDLGYGKQGMEDAEKGQIDCANWLLYYALCGARVDVVLPPWQENWRENFPEHLPKGQHLDINYSQDKGLPDDEPFDAVFVCRSGSWTPTWCDEDFEEFIRQSGLMVVDIHESKGGKELSPRGFDLEAAKESAEQSKLMIAAAMKATQK